MLWPSNKAYSKKNLMRDLWQLLGALANAFQKASPLANAVTILVPLVGLFGSFRWILRRKVKSKDGRIHDFELDVLRRDEALGVLRAS